MATRWSVVLVVGLVSCSSNYVPLSRGRVAVTMVGGKPTYVRDGHTYAHGMLGGGLVDVVHGNPRAEAAAHEYNSRMKTGLLGIILGTAAMAGGSVYAVASVAQEQPEQRNIAIAGVVSLAGMIVMLAGAGYMGTAEPYRWDAINLFNDDADRPQLGPPGWSASRSQVSLRMR